MSFVAITERSSLPSLLTSAPPKDRAISFPKDRIASYSHPIKANRLAPFLRPIVNKLFGVIGDGQVDFMNRCYVSERDYPAAMQGMRTLIEDSLSPYFEEYGVVQLDDTGKGGSIGGRITKNIKHSRGGEVLVLFGGKGAGKSTFINRLLHHTPPLWLKKHAAVAIIDLLKVPEDTQVIRNTIWDRLVADLDVSCLLDADRETVISELFHEKFEIASRQELAGLQKESEAYNNKLNGLLALWKNDKKHCALQLAKRLGKQGKGVVVVVDNTDQYSGEVQDFCFTSAQEICDHLSCMTLISMREERFHNSKIHGLLDAFQNSGFHISSPKPSKVFQKRISYTIDLLRDERRRSEVTASTDEELIEDACRYLEIVSGGFKTSSSPLNTFLTACGHGDIRLSLDLFRSFLLSGYTNVEEMLAAGDWKFLIHQVIKPVMIPSRYFYDEKLSDIPNIYQLRDRRHPSHFTALRILRKLSKGLDGGVPKYYEVAELRAYFASTFNMVDDLEQNLDVLLRHGFIEANNRVDEFNESVDSVKITNYGLYMYTQLAFNFTYIDLVCTDCGVFQGKVSNYLVSSARHEYDLFVKQKRTERVEARLERAESFLRYLAEEEVGENDRYDLGIGQDDLFTSKALKAFMAEKRKVLDSAQKQARKYRPHYKR